MAPLRVLPVIALLALSGVTAAAGQSPPVGLQCGDTITADTTLDATSPAARATAS